MPHHEFTLLGDAVWLDFVNSARGRPPGPTDLLPDAAAFTRWAHAQRLISLDGIPAYAEVHRFRDQLTVLAQAMDAGLKPPTAAISAINGVLAGSSGCCRLTRTSGAWRLQFAPAHPLGPLEAVARSAAATLADPAISVRRCASETCAFYFADSSPNRSRRWCTATCAADLRVERRRGLRR